MTEKYKPNPDDIYPIRMMNGETWPHAVFLKNVIDHPRIEIGDYTYYNDFESPKDFAQKLAPYLHPVSPEKLIIGRFVQIAHGVQFITSSANHLMDGISTYPFAIFGGTWGDVLKVNYTNKGDTVIGHDVWLGHGSVVLPGVTVGSGAIIGTRSVVTKDVPPYAIVAGNPGKVIRYRFEPEEIERLLQISWWDWEMDVIEEYMQAIVDGDIDQLEKGIKS